MHVHDALRASAKRLCTVCWFMTRSPRRVEEFSGLLCFLACYVSLPAMFFGLICSPALAVPGSHTALLRLVPLPNIHFGRFPKLFCSGSSLSGTSVFPTPGRCPRRWSNRGAAN